MSTGSMARGDQPRVTSVILGARRIEQWNDNLGAVDVLLSEEELQSLDQVSQLPAEYPGWMLDMWSQARVKQLENPRSVAPVKGETP